MVIEIGKLLFENLHLCIPALGTGGPVTRYFGKPWQKQTFLTRFQS